MSLNFDLSKIENFVEKCYQGSEEDNTLRYTARCEALIWLMMTIGMTRITEANCMEVYLRVHAEETAYGPRRYNWTKVENEGQTVTTRVDTYYTLDDIKDFIGLSSNVSTVPPGQWWPRFFKTYAEESK